MFVSNSTLDHLTSRFVNGRRALEEISRESTPSYVPSAVQAAAATLTSGSGSGASQGNAQDNTAYKESFAKMMLSLKSQASLAAGVADKDNGVSGQPDVSAEQPERISARQAFLDYMQQPAMDRVREQLTGVSKEAYEAMTPEEQQGVDRKFQEALKQQQEVAKEDINTRIKALKAGLIA
ncbi:hypothetical protein [uncultured Pseudomonas sp.]|uniref:hypothetical protein n=1 Tax=uncultured Pseudomonas sp. TaxID=114707 RepID=UPI0025FE89C7|nr:hypothetical protein [uncultured Pseudomonas sp.]